MAVRLDKDRKASLEKLDLDYSECWEFGHAWKEQTWHPVSSPIRGYEQGLRCDRCRAEKVRLFNRSYIFQYSYMKRYPKGYLWEGYGRRTAEDKAYLRQLAHA